MKRSRPAGGSAAAAIKKAMINRMKRVSKASEGIRGLRWLVNNSGTEMGPVYGPYATQAEFVNGLVELIGSDDHDSDSDTVSIMMFGANGPSFSEFSCGFMSAARLLAGEPNDFGESGQPAYMTPDQWASEAKKVLGIV